ncbi:MAG: CRISPR-associated protein [Planctomycetales bacterium]|nr:CRISPR-associated protein [Planctomycetales bacterium]
MPRNFSQALKLFFNPETVFPFLFGSTFLAVLGNSVYQLFTNMLGTSTRAVIGITIGSLLVFFTSVLWFAYALARMDTGIRPRGKRAPAKRRGLILLVSQADPCRKAIEYHKPVIEKCWLICSTQTLEIVNSLIQEYAGICVSQPIVITDVYDPLEFRNRVDEIYCRLPAGWGTSDVIADYQGMTAHGSVGMVLACLGTRGPLQYIPARLDAQRKPIEALDPIEIVLDGDLGKPKEERVQN